jgi:hypothetical protein
MNFQRFQLNGILLTPCFSGVLTATDRKIAGSTASNHEKPLKRLWIYDAAKHRAEAAVLMKMSRHNAESSN